MYSRVCKFHLYIVDMILVVGGKFQGKLNFVKNNFAVDEDNIFDCEKKYLFNATYSAMSTDKYNVVDNFESYILKKTEEGLSKKDILVDFMTINFHNKTIIICDDISNGLVSIDALERAYRENIGHILCHISKNVSDIYEVIYGIGRKI